MEKRARGRPKKEVDPASALKCIYCGIEKTADASEKNMKNDFYQSRSKLHFGYDKFIPICKSCLDTLYKEYLKKYTQEIEESENKTTLEEYYIEKKAVKRLCMINDIYYSDNLFEAALKHSSNNTMFSSYMKVANLSQYQKKTYENTLKEEQEALDAEHENVILYDDAKNFKKITKKTIKFFGEGLKEESDYEFLQEQYDDWVARHECKTKAQEEVFKQICFTQLELLKAIRAKQDTKDLTATFQKLLETAKLQPKQNHSDTMSDTQTFGTLIDKWENTRPIPEIDEELKDVDNIVLYIDTFFRGHLAKMMGLKNGFSNLYERFMKKYTVTKPEYNGDDNSEVIFDTIFGDQINNEKW